MSDISTPPAESEAPTWEMLGEKFGELLRRGLWLAMTRPANLLLLGIVGLTGWLSYESLSQMAAHNGMGDGVAAAVFPLQLDLAGVPAYQLAADRGRPTSHRWFGGVLAFTTLCGSAYGNCVEHFHWSGWGPTLYISVISPIMCGATLVIWHLPRIQAAARAGLGVLRRRASASKSATPDHPPEISEDETEVTFDEADAHGGPHLVPPPPAEGVRIPEGSFTDTAPHTLRRFAREFYELNGREPDTSTEMYPYLPPEARKQRQAPAAIRYVREQRAREEVS